jgi:hypothetical protein
VEQPDDIISAVTAITTGTSRSIISNLQRQLVEEKEARSRLEGELLNLKKMSEEIAAHL